MRFGSLFSGAGGADLGFERAGLSCAWQCEIDPQASSVLAKHWPDVKRFGDIRKVRKKDLEPVDVIVGGFPCQGLSVAGQRKGLNDERSGLFYELVRLTRLLKPRYLVWENVPGLLSSDRGRDHTRVLRRLADIGYFGAWRCLDARFFGVPQRRRRVFGVFARGHSGAVRCGQILALTEGVRGHSQAGGEAGQDAAFCLTSSVGRNSGGTRVGNAWNTTYVAGCLTTGDGSEGQDIVGRIVAVRTNQTGANGPAVFAELGEGHSSYQDTDEARRPRASSGGGTNANLVLAARCLTSRGQRNDGETDTLIPFSNRGNVTEFAETLRAASHGALPMVATHRGTGEAVCVTGDVTHTLTSQGADASEDGTGRGTPVVAPLYYTHDFNQDRVYGVDGATPALTANDSNRTRNHLVAGGVRRLTPIECERLQSWPDDFTRWGHDGTEFADGPRYRMIGNGIVANCAEWIARRIIPSEE